MTEIEGEDLYDPERVIPLGSKYLGDLQRDFDGNLLKAAAAYNAGPRQAALWSRLRPLGGRRRVLREHLVRGDAPLRGPGARELRPLPRAAGGRARARRRSACALSSLRETLLPALGILILLGEAPPVAWIYVTQPESLAEVGTGAQVAAGVYQVDEARFASGLRLFRARAVPRPRATSGRAPIPRSATRARSSTSPTPSTARAGAASTTTTRSTGRGSSRGRAAPWR